MAQAVSLGHIDNLGSRDSTYDSGGEMRITAIYDNGGKTLDRYTVVTDQTYRNKYCMALGVSEDPSDFSQWSGAIVGDHLGETVSFEKLSAKLQEHIAKRVFERDE